jgi:hypothetical protein
VGRHLLIVYLPPPPSKGGDPPFYYAKWAHFVLLSARRANLATLNNTKKWDFVKVVDHV